MYTWQTRQLSATGYHDIHVVFVHGIVPIASLCWRAAGLIHNPKHWYNFANPKTENYPLLREIDLINMPNRLVLHWFAYDSVDSPISGLDGTAAQLIEGIDVNIRRRFGGKAKIIIMAYSMGAMLAAYAHYYTCSSCANNANGELDIISAIVALNGAFLGSDWVNVKQAQVDLGFNNILHPFPSGAGFAALASPYWHTINPQLGFLQSSSIISRPSKENHNLHYHLRKCPVFLNLLFPIVSDRDFGPVVRYFVEGSKLLGQIRRFHLLDLKSRDAWFTRLWSRGLFGRRIRFDGIVPLYSQCCNGIFEAERPIKYIHQQNHVECYANPSIQTMSVVREALKHALVRVW
jgi:hypothetical protein